MTFVRSELNRREASARSVTFTKPHPDRSSLPTVNVRNPTLSAPNLSHIHFTFCARDSACFRFGPGSPVRGASMHGAASVITFEHPAAHSPPENFFQGFLSHNNSIPSAPRIEMLPIDKEREPKQKAGNPKAPGPLTPAVFPLRLSKAKEISFQNTRTFNNRFPTSSNNV